MRILCVLLLGAMSWGQAKSGEAVPSQLQSAPMTRKFDLCIVAESGKDVCFDRSNGQGGHPEFTQDEKDTVNRQCGKFGYYIDMEKGKMFVPAVKKVRKVCVKHSSLTWGNEPPCEKWGDEEYWSCKDTKNVLLSSEDGTIHVCMRLD